MATKKTGATKAKKKVDESMGEDVGKVDPNPDLDGPDEFDIDPNEGDR